jgi:predicted ATPase/DNA-binding winged helix-turn-helix (wHTH) protein
VSIGGRDIATERADKPDGRTYCFGDYRFHPDRQLLLRCNQPIPLGSRALDLLHALIRNAGTTLSKQELMQFAWPNTFVHDANLKVNIAGLRRALRSGATETPYIATVPGRGYRFVAPLQILDPPTDKAAPAAARANTGKLPPALPLIGREQAIAEVYDALSETRLLTIVGAAGVGKTSLAIALASRSADRFEDGVCYVDLSAIDDPQFIVPAIAFALGRDSNFVNTFDGLAAVLRGRSMMLVLDNCEHLSSGVASVADYLCHLLSSLSIVATSREHLRCRFELVYRLPPLLYPPEGNDADAAGAMSFSAVQLLVHRAQAQGYHLKEPDRPALAAISRRLNGIALAIELAASQLATRSAEALSTILESSFATLVSETDATPARHKTLMATLGWSYRLLSEHEARLLRYLSIFSGGFGLEDAVGAATHLQKGGDEIATWLENLASKSLLTASYREGRRWYRLLDTTRSFTSEQLRQAGELPAAMIGYSLYLLSRFEQAEAEWTWRTREDWAERYGPSGNDLRRAIDWSFGEGENAELGIRLTVAGITLWCEQSSFLENRARVQTALDAAKALPACDRSLEMRLIAVQGINLCQAREFASAVELLEKGIGLANELGNIEYRARMSGLMAGAQFFMGRHSAALASLSQLRAIFDVADISSVEPDIRWHELMIGFCRGGISHAHDGLEKLAREYSTVSRRSQVSRFVIDRFVAIRTFRAVAAWVIGKPRLALETAEEAVGAATSLEHAVSSVFVLGLGAIPVALFSGLFDVAQEWVDLLCHNIALIQDEVWAPNARLYQAAIDHARGLPGALERMRGAIDEMIQSEMLVHAPIRLALLADGALLGDRLDIAETALAQAFHYSRQNGERWSDAELLRLRAMISWRRGDLLHAKRLVKEAIQVAERDCALSFQLRAAIGLAEFELQSGSDEGALGSLALLYRRFDDNFSSADLVRARARVHDRTSGLR